MTKQLEQKLVKLFKGGASKSEVARVIREEMGVKRTQSLHWASTVWENNFDYDYTSPVLNLDKVDTLSAHIVTKEEEKEWDKVKVSQESFDTMAVEYKSTTVKTIDELLDIAKIDRGIWEVDKPLINKWDCASKRNPTKNNPNPGFNIISLFQVKATLRRKQPVDIQDGLDVFIERLANISKKAPSAPRIKKKVGADSVYLIGLVDSHIGKLVWGDETGFGNYDVNIAIERYQEAFYSLLGRVDIDEIDRVVLPIGNDFLNADTEANTTTAGTPQHEDDRWKKVFGKSCNLLADIIEEVSKYKPIDVLQVPGNHDHSRGYYIAEYLRAWFRNNPNVNINNAPTRRKYYNYGVNLIGFTHGKEEKMNDLPMIMANEAKEHWASTSNRLFLLGHYHHQSVKEYNGVKVEILPSLAEACEWHSMKGLIGNQLSSKAFLLHKKYGLTSSYYYNIV